MTVAPATKLGRPRSGAADSAIVAATLESLISVGFGGTTMAGIARDAGVSTATLYRRHDGLVDTVIAALASHTSKTPVPDTGDLGDDLAIYLEQLRRRLRSKRGGSLLSALLDEAGRNPELATALYDTISRPARQGLATMFERAMVRGQMRDDVDVELASDLAVGPLYLRRLEAARPLSSELPRQVADLVVRAVAP